MIKSGKTFIKKDKELVNKKIIFSENADICFANKAILYIKDSEVIINGDKNNPIILRVARGYRFNCNRKLINKIGFLIIKI